MYTHKCTYTYHDSGRYTYAHARLGPITHIHTHAYDKKKTVIMKMRVRRLQIRFLSFSMFFTAETYRRLTF
jgi:hypothetical protein